MAQLLDLSLVPALDDDGNPFSGAELRFYQTGTLTPVTVYANASLTTALSSPVLADSAGRFPAVYVSGATAVRARLSQSGTVVRDIDPLNPLLTSDALTVEGGDTLQEKLDAIEAALAGGGINPRDYGAVGDGIADDTDAFQDAIDAAYADGKGLVVVPPGIYNIASMPALKPGVSIVGQNYASEYYIDSPYDEIRGTMLWRKTTGSSGPILEMATGSAVVGLYFRYDKIGGASTGIVRMGPSATSGECFNALVYSCQFYGCAIDRTTGTYNNATCYGIYGPEATLTPTKQRYFNRIVNNYITNCDEAIHLGGQCNGWIVSGNITRQCYRHYVIDGGTAGTNEVADTLITGFQAQNIGALPTATTAVFTLKGDIQILRASGVSECNGVAFDTTNLNKLVQADFSDYMPNETTGSSLPFSQTTGANGFLVRQPFYNEEPARGGWRRTLIVEPSRTTDKFDFIRGVKASGPFNISGSLPHANGGSGPSQALVAANASSRVILRFQNLPYKVSSHPILHCRLRVFCDGPGTDGAGFAATEFVYRRTSSTGSGAGSLTVYANPVVQGASIGGLHFIHGKTGGDYFGIGFVGGGSTASAFGYIVADLEILALDADTTVQARDWFTNISTEAVAATANDVTDSISLLTAATTSI